ncbi:MAG: Do family serine endopeptidase [Verrucomicrobiota bacterium]|nr:Do family serine endopeptidase [Verrucomicrobiota bacterium]
MTNRKLRCVAVMAGVVCGLLPAAGASAAAAADSKEIELLKKTSRAFSGVAMKAVPAVVFITVEKNVEAGGMYRGPHNDPFNFFGDEFFERFFGRRDRSWAPRQFRQVVGQGSGFLISRDGYILTNNHVVGDADKIRVKTHDGREFNAKRVGSDSRSEVAVIKIEGNDFPYVELGDSAALEVGEWVIAVGTPFGLAETLTVGVVSAKGRSNIGITEYEDFIQTDAAINPGNSGGPLLNIEGKAIGINTAIFSQSGGYMGIGFAIPINMAASIKDQLLKSGKVVRGHIGITIRDVDKDIAAQFGLDAPNGILVDSVAPGSAGEKAGLTHGDVILELNGEKAISSAAFRNMVASNPPGTRFKLSVVREGKKKDILLATQELSDAGSVPGKAQDLFGKFGMELQNLTPDLARRFGCRMGEGVIVSAVDEDGQAAGVGIAPGSLVMSVGRRRVSTVEGFVETVKTTTRNGRVMLRIRTGDRAQYVIMSVE